LACHAPYSNDRFLQPIEHYQTHLQQDFQFLGDFIGAAVGEGLGAVTSLQYKGPPFLCPGYVRAQCFYFPACDQWGQLA